MKGGTLDLLEERSRVRVARHWLRNRQLLEQLDIVGDYLELAGQPIVQVVLGCPCLKQLGDRWVLVSRHSREDVVL